MPTRSTQSRAKRVLWLLALIAICDSNTASHAQEATSRLIDQPPFDRITLTPAAGADVIDTLLLDLPNRKVPSPKPTTGELELRRVTEPTALYKVSWASIAKIELFEQLILSKAQQLTDANEFTEAFAYLEFLNKHYRNLNGLSVAIEKHLKRDAFHSFSEKQYADALAILNALYEYNPKHRGLTAAVDTVINRMMAAHLAARDFSAARTVLDSTPAAFPQLHLKSLAVWRKKFEDGANRQLLAAQRHIKNKEYPEARQALRRAVAILPSVPSVKKSLEELYRLSPQIVVGVSQHGSTSGTPLADMADLRIARLTDPQFVELVDFGSEGGIYSSPWADFVSDDTGLEFNIRLKPNAAKAGLRADVLAIQLLQAAEPSNSINQPTFASLLKSVTIEQGQSVQLRWFHPHVRPEALIKVSMQSLTGSSPLRTYQPVSDEVDENLLRYDIVGNSNTNEKPPSILERVIHSEELAMTALLKGDIDVLDRVAPWQINRLRNAKHITIANYRLPTVHVLLPNYSKPLMRRREFRRALCYGINRQQIVKDIILGGTSHPGFRVLSGPMPAGASISDPLGYGYKQQLRPRSYEPRLAAVLATVARTSLKKHDEAVKSSSTTEQNNDQPTPDQPTEEAEVEPLVLAYPPDAVAQTTCQAIKRQLGAIGIPVKLQQISPTISATPIDYDLLYTELAIWEPITDMQRLLGTQGIVGHCSPAMSVALDAIDQARNWQEARTRLRDLHDVAFYDLPVVPLWQTYHSFAYRKTLHGISHSPIALYQDVTRWKISSNGATK